ncbi:MAG: hypothetical protein AAF682_02115 [Planctomycetota bacterium]
MSEGLTDPCEETKDPTSCWLGEMEASSFAEGHVARADVEGHEGGPACSVENQSACAASSSFNFTFKDPCNKHCPNPYVNGLASGSAEVDAESVICANGHNWAVTYGVGEVKCTLWDIAEICVCTLEAGKDSESEWVYVGTIKINGLPVDFQVPVITGSGPKTGSCSGQGAGGDKVGMFTIIFQTSITIAGHADGCILDTAEVEGFGALQSEALVNLAFELCDEGCDTEGETPH